MHIAYTQMCMVNANKIKIIKNKNKVLVQFQGELLQHGKAEKSMKGYNVFLAILIFLLAVVSAVFSYFLWEKNDALVTGHGHFAKQLDKAVKTLESNSGETLSGAVNEDSLNHKVAPATLDELLTKYNDLTSKVLKERDTLALTLENVGGALEMPGNPAQADYAELGKYSDASQKIYNFASAYNTRNNAIFRMIAASARNLNSNISINTAHLKGSKYSAEYKKLDDEINFWKTRHAEYTGQVAAISGELKGGSVNSTRDGYKSGLAKVVSKAKEVYGNFKKFENLYMYSCFFTSLAISPTTRRMCAATGCRSVV